MSVDNIGGLLFHGPDPGASQCVLIPHTICDPQAFLALPYPVSYPLTTLTREDDWLLPYRLATTILFDTHSGHPGHFGADYSRELNPIATKSQPSNLAEARRGDWGELLKREWAISH